MGYNKSVRLLIQHTLSVSSSTQFSLCTITIGDPITCFCPFSSVFLAEFNTAIVDNRSILTNNIIRVMLYFKGGGEIERAENLNQ